MIGMREGGSEDGREGDCDVFLRVASKRVNGWDCLICGVIRTIEAKNVPYIIFYEY